MWRCPFLITASAILNPPISSSGTTAGIFFVESRQLTRTEGIYENDDGAIID